MRRDRFETLAFVALLATTSASLAVPALAQDVVRHRSVQSTTTGAEASIAYRGLTINRPPPQGLPLPGDDASDIYQDGPVRYNDIRDFSPAPYTTSGVQYPYGLDGIGGYGSSLDMGGQDSALYDRGAGTP